MRLGVRPAVGQVVTVVGIGFCGGYTGFFIFSYQVATCSRHDRSENPRRTAPRLDMWIYETSPEREESKKAVMCPFQGCRRHSGWPASTGVRSLLMATYEYLCSRCGPFDVKLAIGTAPKAYGCPDCAGAARRVYSSPGFSRTSHAVTALHAREEQAREAPEVVSEVPPGRTVRQQVHPALSRLPRP
ncbi:FmdB family zinc ribbon protein [Streptomyces sp. NPDC005728]|uniref:FmdB family zinc ribbon protein n=1 Tax=Streptomyces sp. NPDC005728 TaxID=3157054 RepID=UPI003406C457